MNGYKFLKNPWVGPFLALLVLLLLFSFLSPDTFARSANLTTMLRQTAVLAIASVGMTLVMVQGGIDLSVGSVVAITTVVVARALRADLGLGEVVVLGVATGAIAGLVNGLLVNLLNITPFIVTLGTMSVLRGAAKGLANEQKIDANPRGLDAWMAPVQQGEPWLFPAGVWLAMILAALAALFLAYTRWGRHVVAVGSNADNARLCGISVERVRLLVYVLAGLCAGIAGVLEFSTLTVGDPTDSVGLELEVIAAVVIGGGSLAGGQGSVAGALLGAFLLTTIKTGCTHVGVPNWVQEIVTGVIIVVAMGVDRLRQKLR
ncbi:MAG: ABC transporter permease [Polyangiaceae bacterium]|nr:ABC transporter permease [Polyangiaceae bacterium]